MGNFTIKEFQRLAVLAIASFSFSYCAPPTAGDPFALDFKGNSTEIPNAPSQLSVIRESANHINLNWIDSSANETKFIVDRCSDSRCTAIVQSFTLAPDSASFSDTGVVSSVDYFYRVAAANNAGTSSSDIVSTTNCSFSFASPSLSILAPASSGTNFVSTQVGCRWSATSLDSFVSITAGQSAVGSATLSFSILPNTSSSVRSGKIRLTGPVGSNAEFVVNQAGTACTYTISPATASTSAAAGSNTVSVTPNLSTCNWTAVSNSAFLSITAGATGTGNGTVTYSAAANTNASTRSGNLTIAGQTFTVNQAAAACTYSISPTSASALAAAGSASVAVTTNGPSCTWTAASNSAFLSITAGASGAGNGTVTYSAATNSSTSIRTGTLTIAGSTFTLNQAGTTCTYIISPTSASAIAAGGSSTVSITTNISTCSWTATSNSAFLSISAGATGTGNGTVTYSAAANANASTRSGTLTIAGQTFTVNQAAAACTYSISPTSASALAAGGSASVAVTTNGPSCTWTAASNSAFLSITAGASGMGSGNVTYSASQNSTTTSRTGTLTIADQTFTVNQAAAACTYSISPTSASALAAGGSASVAVTTNGASCTWTAASNSAFLSLTAGTAGTGNGTVTYSTGLNSAASSRSGTLTIAGQTFTVNQAAAACTYSISPTSASARAAGGSASVSVTTNGTSCSRTATSNSAFLSITAGGTGAGNGNITYSVAPNTTVATRTGTLTIAGQTFTVNQAAAACTYSISPTSASAIAAGGSASVAVTTNGASCAWTAASNSAFLSITAGASGMGNGNVTYSASLNSATTSRTGTLTIAGQTFTVNQAGTVVVAPAITFPIELIVNTGTAIAPTSPMNTGGVITSCTSSPTLPAGISLSSSCEVSGTPTAARSRTLYQITASNAGGNSAGNLYITVQRLSNYRAAWMKGDKEGWLFGFGSAVQGTAGVYASANTPGSRFGAAYTSDNAGGAILFAGYGHNSDVNGGYLNDLWKFNGTDWAWMSGGSLIGNNGTYGVRGTAAAGNWPPARQSPSSWYNPATASFYIYGGVSPSGSEYNDLWKYTGSTWTWMNGNAGETLRVPVYGTIKVPAAANNPGTRYGSTSFIDASGNLWLFGGYSQAARGYLNDLWRFDGTNWTWMAGSSTPNTLGVYGTKNIGAPANMPGARSDAAGWAKSDGSLWLFAGTGYGAAGSSSTLNDLWKFDGTNWIWISGAQTVESAGNYTLKGITDSSSMPSARAKTVAWKDAAGNLWLFGGTETNLNYLSDIWKFDGTNWGWMSGARTFNQLGVYGTKGILSSSNSIGTRFDAAGWMGSDSNLYIFGGQGGSSSYEDDELNDLWKIETSVN